MISALMPTAKRADIAFERGEGVRLWADDGRRFLDFGAGIATSSLGHGHPHLAEAIARQAAKIIHSSSLYRVRQAEDLAARHVAASFADSVFSATRAPRRTRAWSRPCANTTPRQAIPNATG